MLPDADPDILSRFFYRDSMGSRKNKKPAIWKRPVVCSFKRT